MAKKLQNLQEEESLQEQFNNKVEEVSILKRQTIKELIAPSGIDASDIDHLEIISNVKNMQEVSLYLHFQECVHSLNFFETCISLVI